jgi:hypothetical protein
MSQIPIDTAFYLLLRSTGRCGTLPASDSNTIRHLRVFTSSRNRLFDLTFIPRRAKESETLEPREKTTRVELHQESRRNKWQTWE